MLDTDQPMDVWIYLKPMWLLSITQILRYITVHTCIVHPNMFIWLLGMFGWSFLSVFYKNSYNSLSIDSLDVFLAIYLNKPVELVDISLGKTRLGDDIPQNLDCKYAAKISNQRLESLNQRWNNLNTKPGFFHQKCNHLLKCCSNLSFRK